MTRFAIQNNRTTFILLLVIFAAGAVVYVDMPRAMDPGFTIRTALVLTYFPGASPERVENLVTDKLEKAIQEMPELDVVRSQSTTGVSVVYADIQESYDDMRPIWDSLRRKVQAAQGDLPDQVIGPFVNDEFGDTFGVILSITGEDFSYAELKEVADTIRDELLRLPDTAKVAIYGAQEERVFVEYNDASLSEKGLSTLYLKQVLEARNIVIPGGNINTGVERIVLEPSGNFDSVQDLKRTVINLPGSSEMVFLEDIATIERGYVDPARSKMTAGGVRALGLAVSMRQGGNLVRLGEHVQALLDRLPGQFPIGLDFELVAFEPERVDKKISDFTANVYQAIAIVLLVMLLLLGLRTGLIVASLIPAAMVSAILVMSFLGIGLDQMSLAALIIALGMLVDNAIVMSESIMVQMEGGSPALDAAVRSSKELRIPLLTSSLTTAAAFLPIYLAESTVGEYTASLFKVVSITLLCSWLLALTMIPLLCVMFLKLKAKPQQESFNSRFYRFYRNVLLTFLRFRWITVAVVAVIFVLAMQGAAQLPNIFFPASDTPMFTAEFDLPLGTAIEYSEELVGQIDKFVSEELKTGQDRAEGVVSWSTYIGQGAPRFTLSYSPEQQSPEYSIMVLNTTSRQVIPGLIATMEDFCRQNFPDMKATVKALPTGPIIKNPIEVRISGQQASRLYVIADQVKAKLGELSGTKNIDDDWGQRTKKLVVKIDELRARRSGVSNQDVAISLQTVLSGFNTTDYREGDEIIPVTLRSQAADRQDIGKLEGLNVYAQTTGRNVPLKQVADIEVVFEPAKIYRRNRLKTITVSSSTDPGVTPAEITAQLIPWLEAEQQNWGLGYLYGLGGELEQSGKGNQSISQKLPIAGLIIVLLLVGQFNSVRRALIVLLTIPLGLIGVIAGLLLMDSYFGFMTLLGIVSLAGIVINNAIVLLDRMRIEVEENGLEPARAVIESAQKRLRPILLTTLTTVGGLIPLYLGGGPMWEPMAVAIMFGLVFATLLTLGVVPVLYSIFFRVSFKGFSY